MKKWERKRKTGATTNEEIRKGENQSTTYGEGKACHQMRSSNTGKTGRTSESSVFRQTLKTRRSEKQGTGRFHPPVTGARYSSNRPFVYAQGNGLPSGGPPGRSMRAETGGGDSRARKDVT